MLKILSALAIHFQKCVAEAEIGVFKRTSALKSGVSHLNRVLKLVKILRGSLKAQTDTPTDTPRSDFWRHRFYKRL